jgi:hypothetical protein
MGVPVTQFQPLSFQQAAPGVAGLEAGANIADTNAKQMGQVLQNMILSTQAQYAPANAQQALQASTLHNQMTSAQLPYAGQLAQAQAANVGAQAALTGAMVPYAGYKAMGPYYAALSHIQQAQTATDNSYRAFLATPEGQQLVQKNPDLAQAVYQMMLRQAGDVSNGFGSKYGLPTPGNYPTTPDNLQSNPQPSAPGQSNSLPSVNANAAGGNPPAVDPNQIARLQQVLTNGGGTGVPSPEAQIVQNAAQNQFLNTNLTSTQQNQMVRANSADAILQQIAPLMPSVAKFSGLAGKAGEKVSQFAQAAGMGTSQDYSNFQVATQKMQVFGNELNLALGGHPTDTQKKMIEDISNPNLWDKNPQQTLTEFNSLVQSLKAVSGQLAKTPGQGLQTLQANIANPPYVGASPSMVPITYKGQKGMVPASRLKDYLAQGAQEGG